MKTITRNLLAFGLTVLFCQAVGAATFLWNNPSVGANNWSDSANWLPATGSPGIGDTAVFGDTGVSPDALTVNNVVNANTSVAILNFTNTTSVTTGPWHVTQIPPGVALTVSNLTVGLGTATPSAGLKTLAAFTGGGSLLGYGILTAGNTASASGNPGTTLDLSGLDTFFWSNSAATMNIGIANRSAVDLKLAANSNSITTGTLNLCTTSTGSTAAGTLTLGGGTNIINANAINSALARNSCTIQFAGATGGLRIRGSAGDEASRADITLGNRTSGGGATSTGQLLANGHPVDIKLDTLNLGRAENATANNTGTGVISYDTGIMDVTFVNLASTSVSNVNANGTINVGAGGTLVAESVSMTDLLGGTGLGNGAINVTGGTMICSNNITKANIGGVGTLTLSGAALTMVSGVIGSPAVPIDTLSAGDSVLKLAVNGTTTNINVTTLTMTSTTNNVIRIVSLPIITSFPVQLPLIRYALGSSDFQLGGLPAGYTGTLVNSAGSVDLLISNGPITVRPLTWTGTPDGNWDSLTANWLYSGNATTYAAGDIVTFDDSASGTTTVNLTASLAPTSATVNNSAKNYTFSGPGALVGGGLVKDGPGQLTIANTGVNTFTNGITILSGTVRLSGAPDRLPTNGDITIADASGATLDLNNLNQTTETLNGGGALGGAVSMGSGTLTVWGGGMFGGTISGSGQLIKTNYETGGTLTLSNANTYTGGTIVGGYSNNTTLAIANMTGSGTGSGFVRVLTNGTFSIGAATPGGSTAAAVITNEGIVRVSRSDEMELSNSIVGPGLLQVQDSALVVIRGTNGHTGGTAVQRAKLLIDNPGAVGSGPITLQNSAPGVLQLSNSISLANALNIASKPSAAGQIPHIENVSGTNTLSGPLSLTANGANGWGFYATAGHLRITGNVVPVTSAQTSQNTTRILQLRGDATGEWSGAIINTVNSTTNLALNKAGLGTWTLSGQNTYTGPTTINEGTILVNGSLGNTAVSVTGGTLGGTGVINGAVNVLGTLSPGTSIGTLTINSNLSLFGTTIMEVSTPACDRVRGVNDLTLGGLLQVVVVGTLQGGEVFRLFEAKTITGDFGYDLPALPPGLSWDTTSVPLDGKLKVIGGTLTPPPLQVTRNGNQLTFAWNHVSFKLQSQTNSLNAGIGANWTDYPGGDSSPVIVPINPSNPTVFFRLISQ